MKTAIVGMGKVGGAVAHALVCEGMAEELVLVSRNTRRAKGEAADLTHAGAMLPHVTRVTGGGPELLAGSDLVILTHSVPTESPDRQLLAAGNGCLFRETLPRYLAECPNAVVVVVSNPVDSLTWLTCQLVDLPPSRVIGVGTIIDSARLRALLSERYHIHTDDLRVYVLGEHGDKQFPSVTLASTGGVRFEDRDGIRQAFHDAVQSAYTVFSSKGYTNYAVAQAIAMVVRCVRRDEHRTLPVSVPINGFLGVDGVCLSLPCVVGRSGIEKVLYPEFSEEEADAFRQSADAVQRTIAALG